MRQAGQPFPNLFWMDFKRLVSLEMINPLFGGILAKKQSYITNCDPETEKVISEIQSYIREIEKDASLHEEKNFDKRVEAIDSIAFLVIDRIEELQRKTALPRKLILLKHRIEKVKSELEDIDIRLFQLLQAGIRTGRYTGQEFENLIKKYVDFNFGDNQRQAKAGYDNLDLLINGLSLFQTLPEQTKALEPDMVYYQKTPARIVFELVERSHFTKDDVFFDLGSGLGQVTILVNLLAGITAKGVEFEPAFCDYARDCAANLNLSNVTFTNADARKADYSKGTVFFMFTPFRGEILQEVLDLLRKESLRRKIKIITYGPCTAIVASQNWLNFLTPGDQNIYTPGFFSSF